MKIVLILATPNKYSKAAERGKPFKYYAPTTLLQLVSLIPSDIRCKVEIIDQGIEPVPDEIDADLVGISAVTCAVPEAYRIANVIRKRGIKVVIGGFHATLFPEEVQKHADTVIIGYAEKVWPQLLIDFSKNRMKRIYKNRPVTTLKLLPLDRSLLKNSYFIKNTIEVTRGCPNNCSFCVIPKITNQSITFPEIKDVVKEIERMGKEVVFLDANPFAYTDYFKKLMREIMPLNIRWAAGASLKYLIDKELISLAKKSGLRGLLVGFESVNQSSLNAVNKGFNRVQNYLETVNYLHDNGIGILGSFVFGFDGDDPSVFEKTVEFVNKARIELVKYSILTPYPQTKLFRKLQKEHRLLTQDWELYDGEHTVFRPKLMKVEKLEEGYRWAIKQTYSISSILRRTAKFTPLSLYSLPANIGFRRIFFESK